jgi:peptidoglycan/LPS O-acetylase OafA/YrhL
MDLPVQRSSNLDIPDRAINSQEGTARVPEEERSGTRIQLSGHIPKLDSLRGVAILLVVTYHAYGGDIDYRKWHGAARYFLYLSRYGYTGVELFFVLSGFLITSILLKSKPRPDYYKSFYMRRALRILPAYFAILIVIKIWMGVTWKYILACLLYIANMASLVGARTTEYSSLWSLAVEEQFYLIWPFCVRKCRERSLLRLAIGLCVFLPIARLVVTILFPHVDIRYKTYFIADYLAYGALITICLHLGYIHARNIQRIARWLIVLGAVLSLAVVCVGYADHGFRYVSPVLRSMGVLPFLWMYSGMVLWAIACHHFGDRSSNAVLSFLGYISYGLYLIHEFLFYEYGKLTAHGYLSQLNRSFFILSVRFICVAAVAIFLAYLSRRFYEGYFLHIRTKTR